MKILDWMHRKLQPATNYSRVSRTMAPAFEHDAVDLLESAHRPISATGTEPDTETPLLLHVNLAGILTIGTLGHSHPLFLPHFQEEPNLELPEKQIQATTAEAEAAKPPPQITLLQPATELFMIKTEHSVVEIHVPEEKIMAVPLLKEDRERKERTTLADLLAADGDQPPAVAGPIKSLPASDLKSDGKEKKKVNKRKKKKGDDLESSQSRSPAAAERIHRMITRMVKKKVHPEVAATAKKGGGAAAVVGGGGGGGGAA